jgi:hypothetical protein
VLLHVDIQTSQKKFLLELLKIGLLFSIGYCYWDHYLVGGQSWAQSAFYCVSGQFFYFFFLLKCLFVDIRIEQNLKSLVQVSSSGMTLSLLVAIVFYRVWHLPIMFELSLSAFSFILFSFTFTRALYQKILIYIPCLLCIV